MNNKQWLTLVLEGPIKHDDLKNFFFVVGDKLITTDRCRMHCIPLPDQLKGTEVLDHFTKRKMSKLQYEERVGKLPDIAKVLRACEESALDHEVPMDLWMPVDDEYVSHFLTGVRLDRRWFVDAAGGHGPEDIKCYNAGPDQPVKFIVVVGGGEGEGEGGGRVAWVMPCFDTLAEAKEK